MTTQIRNDDQINLILSDVDGRQEPNNNWRSAVSATMLLPGLRGLWPMSAFVAGGNVPDNSDNGRTLTYNGNPLFDYENLVPFLSLDGTGDWLARADEAGLDILGTEAYVTANKRGISMGGWFYFDRLAVNEDLMTKWAGAPQQSWYLRKLAANTISFNVQDGGGVNFTATTTATVAIDTWYHIVGTFFANASIEVYVNAVQTQNVAAPVASIRNSNADFRIGANGAGANALQGDVSLQWLSTMALSSALVNAHYQNTRTAYNV